MAIDKKPDARKLDHATFEAMRLRAIEATKAGMMATDLALAGVHRRTVFRWLADYYKGGEQALKAKPIPGRPSKLDEPQIQSLAQTFTDQTPLQHGFKVGLWTLSILRELIRRQFTPCPSPRSAPEPHHVAARHYSTKTALPGLAAGSLAGAQLGE